MTVTPRYDLINHIITSGMDAGWRRRAAAECLKSKPRRFLDLCCGTGDMVVEVGRQAGYDAELYGVDYSQPMLEAAALKAAAKLPHRQIKLIIADAASLPFPDNYFDVIGISFAFRNLTYKNPHAAEHVTEILRVLKPGGRFVIVESSQPQTAVTRFIAHFYIRLFVGPVGGLLSGNRPAYRYLAESARNFYSGDGLKKLLADGGFRRVDFRLLFFGAAAIHTAEK